MFQQVPPKVARPDSWGERGLYHHEWGGWIQIVRPLNPTFTTSRHLLPPTLNTTRAASMMRAWASRLFSVWMSGLPEVLPPRSRVRSLLRVIEALFRAVSEEPLSRLDLVEPDVPLGGLGGSDFDRGESVSGQRSSEPMLSIADRNRERRRRSTPMRAPC